MIDASKLMNADPKKKSQRNFFIQANKKIVSIGGLLGDSVLKRNQRRLRKKREDQLKKRNEQENKLEDKKTNAKLDFRKPLGRVVGLKNLIQGFRDAIGKILFGLFGIILLKNLPTLVRVLPLVVGAADFLSKVGVGLVDAFASIIDAGYTAYDSTKNFLKDVGGQDLAENFDKFAGAVSSIIDILILATIIKSSTDFGFGPRKRPTTRRQNFFYKPGGRGPGIRPKAPKTPQIPLSPRGAPVAPPAPVVKPARKFIPRRVVIPAPSKVTIPKKVRDLVTSGGGGGTGSTVAPPESRPLRLTPEEKIRRSRNNLTKRRLQRAYEQFYERLGGPDVSVSDIATKDLIDELFIEQLNLDPVKDAKRLKEIAKDIDDLITMNAAERASAKLPPETQAKIRVDAQSAFDDGAGGGQRGAQILDDLLGKPTTTPTGPNLGQRILNRIKTNPGAAIRSIRTFGAELALDVALNSLVDFGFLQLDKARIKDRVKKLSTFDPEKRKEEVQKVIDRVERRFRYYKSGVSVLEKITAMGGETSTDRQMSNDLALLYALGATGLVDFGDYDVSDFLLEQKRFTDVTGMPPKVDLKKLKASGATDTDVKAAVRGAESGNDYGATFRRYLGGFSRRGEDITKMSISEVVQYQKDYIEHQRKLGIPVGMRSAAVGAYQMLYPEVAAKATGVSLNAKFDKKTQDILANYYLDVAGRQQFLKGEISAEEYNDRLAGQFASLKKASGSGAYDDDGLNKAYQNILPLLKKQSNDRSQSLKETTSYDEQASTIIINKQTLISSTPQMSSSGGGLVVQGSSGSDSKNILYMIG